MPHLTNQEGLNHEANFYGFYTQEGVQANWNWAKIFTEQDVMNFTTQRFLSLSICEYPTLEGDLSSSKERPEVNPVIKFKSILSAFQKAKDQEKWTRKSEDKFNFPEPVKPVLHSPQLEANRFNQLQTRNWRPGDHFNQSGGIPEVLSCTRTQEISRFNGESLKSNRSYLWKDWTIFRFDPFQAIPIQPGEPDDVQTNPRHPGDIIQEPEEFYNFIPCTSPHRNKKIPIITKLPYLESLAFKLQQLFFYQGKDEISIYQAFKKVPRKLSYPLKPSRFKKNQVSHLEPKSHKRLQRLVFDFVSLLDLIQREILCCLIDFGSLVCLCKSNKLSTQIERVNHFDPSFHQIERFNQTFLRKSTSSHHLIKLRVIHIQQPDSILSFGGDDVVIRSATEPEVNPKPYSTSQGANQDIRARKMPYLTNQEGLNHEANFYGFYTQEGVQANWNWAKIFTEQDVMNFTTQRFLSLSICEYPTLEGDLSSSKERPEVNPVIKFKSILSAFQKAKDQEKWTRKSEDMFNLPEPVKPVLHSPQLEANRFNQLQTRNWRPGDHFNQSGGIPEVLSCTRTQEISRFNGESVKSNRSYLWKDWTIFRFDPFQAIPIQPGEPDDVQTKPRHPGDIIQEPEEFYNFIPCTSPHRNKKIPIITKLPYLESLAFKLQQLFFYQGKDEISIYQAFKKVPRKLSYPLKPSRFKKNQVSHLEPKSHKRLQRLFVCANQTSTVHRLRESITSIHHSIRLRDSIKPSSANPLQAII
ncbi:hypothetical protein YC2023_108196 [Brassica napus]